MSHKMVYIFLDLGILRGPNIFGKHLRTEKLPIWCILEMCKYGHCSCSFSNGNKYLVYEQYTAVQVTPVTVKYDFIYTKSWNGTYARTNTVFEAMAMHKQIGSILYELVSCGISTWSRCHEEKNSNNREISVYLTYILWSGCMKWWRRRPVIKI